MNIEIRYNDETFWIRSYQELLPELEQRGSLESYLEGVRKDYPAVLEAFRHPGVRSHQAASWMALMNRVGISFSKDWHEVLSALWERPSPKSKWSAEEQQMFAAHALTLIPSTPSAPLEALVEPLYEKWLRLLDHGEQHRAYDVQQTLEALGAHPASTLKIWLEIRGIVSSDAVDLRMAASPEARTHPLLRGHLLKTRSPRVRLALLQQEAVRRDPGARLALLNHAAEKVDLDAAKVVVADAEAWQDRETWRHLARIGDASVHRQLLSSPQLRRDAAVCGELVRRADLGALSHLFAASEWLESPEVRAAARERKIAAALQSLVLKGPLDEVEESWSLLWTQSPDEAVRVWTRAGKERQERVGGAVLRRLLGGSLGEGSLERLERMAEGGALPLAPLDFQPLLSATPSRVRERAIRLLGRLRQGEEGPARPQGSTLPSRSPVR